MSKKSPAELKEQSSAEVKKTAGRTTGAKGRKTAPKKPAASKTATTKKTPAAKKAAGENIVKPAAKKAPAKKAAAGPIGSHQTEAQVKAAEAVYQTEALDGAAIARAKSEVKGTPYTDVKAAAHASRVELAKKSVAENNAQVNLRARSLKDGQEAAKKASKPVRKPAAKAAKAPKATTKRTIVYAGIPKVKGKAYAAVVPAAQAKAALASRAELAKKSAAENNAQTNLAAQSAKFLLEQAHQSAAQVAAGEAAYAKEAADGVAYDKGVAALADKKKAEKAYTESQAHQSAAQIAAGEAAYAKEAADGVAYDKGVAALANKKKAEKAYTESQAHQSAAQIAAGEAAYAQAAQAGARYNEAVAAMAPEMASRVELAKKSAAENNAQVNLAARSAASAKEAVKNLPKRKKAKKVNAVDQSKAAAAAITQRIINETADGVRLIHGIEQVEGTPYEDVVKAAKAEAAMASRAALAAKGQRKPADSMKKAELTEEKSAFYSTLDDQTLIAMVQAAGLDMDLGSMCEELQNSLNIDELIADYTAQAAKASTYDFARDGFDASVVPFLAHRIADRLPHKAQDRVDFVTRLNQDVERMLINDSLNDTAVYNDLFEDVKNILVYAQNHDHNTLAEVENILSTSLTPLIDRFMTVAYTILPGWQYKDVKYYEGFLYGVLSQFDDLRGWHNRAMMDIADLYIKHGDYARGDADYGYVLRENQLKDQIYYRYASVYRPFDLQRAKRIAQDALRVIDGRYDYYGPIIEILHS